MDLADRTRPDLYDESADPDVWSRMSVGDKRLTWAEVAEHREDELRRLRPLATLLSDLDRCRHGRHQGDVCGGASGCNGPSKGNDLLLPGTRVGTTLDGRALVVPLDPHVLTDPAAWVEAP